MVTCTEWSQISIVWIARGIKPLFGDPPEGYAGCVETNSNTTGSLAVSSACGGVTLPFLVVKVPCWVWCVLQFSTWSKTSVNAVTRLLTIWVCTHQSWPSCLLCHEIAKRCHTVNHSQVRSALDPDMIILTIQCHAFHSELRGRPFKARKIHSTSTKSTPMFTNCFRASLNTSRYNRYWHVHAWFTVIAVQWSCIICSPYRLMLMY